MVLHFHSSSQISWLPQRPLLHWANCLLLWTSGCILDPFFVDLVWYSKHNCFYSIRIHRRCDLYKTHCLCKQHYWFCENIDVHWIRFCCAVHRRHNILAFPISTEEIMKNAWKCIHFQWFWASHASHSTKEIMTNALESLRFLWFQAFHAYHTTEEIIINAWRSIHFQWFWASHASHSTEEIIKILGINAFPMTIGFSRFLFHRRNHRKCMEIQT